MKEKILNQLKKYKESDGKLALAKIEKKRKEILVRKLKKEIKIKTTSSYSESGTKTNKTSSQVENSVVNKECEIENLEREIENLNEKIEMLELDLKEANIRLECLTYLEKEVIVAYYIDKLTMQEIGESTYYRVRRQTRGRKAIKDLIEKIERKLEKLEV